MNVKLNESDYQHFIIELIAASIEDYLDFVDTNPEEEYADWIYFIERLKVKGFHNELRPIRPNTNPKARYAARAIVRQFKDRHDQNKNITTLM